MPNEERTLAAALALHKTGTEVFHGYLLAGQLKKQPSSERVMAYSTLYRCLDRLEDRGLVRSWWAQDNSESGGPPRRQFTLSPDGIEAASKLPAPEPADFSWGTA